MKKTTSLMLSLILMMFIISEKSHACTNFLITKGASKDGSTMITYSADSHVLYGELYFWPAMKYKPGTMFDVYEWDSGRFLGTIEQAPVTYSVVGNMNQYQLAISETTYGGRGELRNRDGLMDYGSLIYLTLQRAKNAREAIHTIVTLTEKYGYCSSGESFSISDPNEVWIMEMIGKGQGKKGMAFVARLVPDGYISGHANQARIQTFPQANGTTSITSAEIDKIFNPSVETVYAADVVTVARDFGWYDGTDADFSFSDVYAPVDFGAARFCDARVWAGFNRVNSTMGEYLNYAMGYDLENRMPLWVKPDNKLSLEDVMGLMRDYYQNTPMDMTKDIGAGPYANTVRWRPMSWKVDGKEYLHERATSTQQTGFSFVTQSRSWLPDPVGGILWFGVDDTYYTVYTPMYCGITSVPHSFAVGNGDMMTYSADAAFWVFNEVTNFVYSRANVMTPDLQAKQKELEHKYMAETADIDARAAELFNSTAKGAAKKGTDMITAYSVNAGNNTVKEWRELYKFLFTKYMDGNVKTRRPVPEGYKYIAPEVKQPGYPQEWLMRIVIDAGDKLKVPESAGN
ncbi:MAG TPA: C69 family dipeptidase [Bacteroidales bacterium]|jgi:dipeptidase|nr:C69 family dipeptidase [Bacteroidales bacterium]HNY56755.1 C69 family dipeptidase [Bacteroidales bacterium]HOC05384.1 C69 family dipeptidase [Bacteroidales bacterium]HPH74927.1 C69 family dipeptidase [Bacteroidales bacterium]HPO40970.1 C69 family dipeptidase [Bacteroidales bacterium]